MSALLRTGRRLAGRMRSIARDARGSPFALESEGNISVGRESYHNGAFRVLGHQPVTIGSYCAIGRDVRLITENHDPSFLAIQGSLYRRMWQAPHPGAALDPPNPERTRGGITIGNDVWLGDGCIVMSGVCIGDGACIGASAVVTHDVPAYTVCAGVPSRVLRSRFEPDVAQFLVELRWWDWTDERIRANRELFETNIRSITVDELRRLVR